MTEPDPIARNIDLGEQVSPDQVARYALAAQASSEGIYDWNVLTNHLYTSPRLRELIGLVGSDSANIDWNRRIHPDDYDRYHEAIVAHFKRQSPRLRCEYRVRVRSGEYRWFLDSGLAVRDDAGRCTRLVGAISDITEKRNAEGALRESEERYALAMNAVNEAVYDWQVDRDEIYYSPNIHLLLGFSAEELRTPQDWRQRIHPDDITPYTTALIDHFKGRTPRFEAAYRYRAPDGSWRWARQHGIALRDNTGRAYRVIGATGDVTDAKLTEKALQTAQDRLMQTEKLASLGQVTAGIAHEIKNPLNFVNNFSALSTELVDEMSSVLAKARLDDENRAQLDEIQQLLKSNLEKVVEHGKRADSIVKNMLLHSRAGSGEHRPADINAIIDESLNLAYHGARAEKPGFDITLHRQFDPSAGMADVYPQEITRVLLNLVANGFYATAKRSRNAAEGFEPMLSAATRSLGDKVEIRIRDNGTGILADVKARLFTPFFTTKPPGEGTGLGLSMSHDIIVKQHGGTIDVETEPDAFTEFIITLPRSHTTSNSKRDDR